MNVPPPPPPHHHSTRAFDAVKWHTMYYDGIHERVLVQPHVCCCYAQCDVWRKLERMHARNVYDEGMGALRVDVWLMVRVQIYCFGVGGEDENGQAYTQHTTHHILYSIYTNTHDRCSCVRTRATKPICCVLFGLNTYITMMERGQSSVRARRRRASCVCAILLCSKLIRIPRRLNYDAMCRHISFFTTVCAVQRERVRKERECARACSSKSARICRHTNAHTRAIQSRTHSRQNNIILLNKIIHIVGENVECDTRVRTNFALKIYTNLGLWMRPTLWVGPNGSIYAVWLCWCMLIE